MKHRSLFTLTILLLVAVLGTASHFRAGHAYHESPMLTAMVDAGELPPVAERLPVNPAVVEPFNEVGHLRWNHARRLHGRKSGLGRSLVYRRMGKPRVVGTRFLWCDPQYRRKLGSERRRSYLHLPPARRHQVVGWRSLHRRRHHVLH